MYICMSFAHRQSKRETFYYAVIEFVLRNLYKAGKVNKIYKIGSMHKKDDRLITLKDLAGFEL